MAATTPTVDDQVLEDLEFDIPCEVTTDGHPCNAPATWWVLVRNHCDPSSFEATWCEDHFKYVMAGGPVICATCLNPIHARLHIIRTERLR